jgi:hypothetical protein
LIGALYRTTKTDIVSFRRESARPQRTSLWCRFYLDLFIALLLLVGYMGAIPTSFAAPAVSLLDLAGPSSQYNPYDVPPVQAIIPFSQIALLLAALLIICLVALLLMARIVSRPSLSSTLRLNED